MCTIKALVALGAIDDLVVVRQTDVKLLFLLMIKVVKIVGPTLDGKYELGINRLDID